MIHQALETQVCTLGKFLVCVRSETPDNSTKQLGKEICRARKRDRVLWLLCQYDNQSMIFHLHPMRIPWKMSLANQLSDLIRIPACVSGQGWGLSCLTPFGGRTIQYRSSSDAAFHLPSTLLKTVHLPYFSGHWRDRSHPPTL